MGVSADQWLSTLAAAALPAFHCRRADGQLAMVSRTPEFMAVMQAVSGRLDERSLLAQLDDQWPPAAGAAPFAIEAAYEPAWQCMIHAVDAEQGDFLAILRLTEELPTPTDAYFRIVENLPDVVIRYDNSLRCLYSNPALAEFTGIPSQARVGKTIPEMADAALTGDLEAAYRRVLDTGQPVEVELDYAGPSGPHHYLGRATPEFDTTGGQVSTILSVVRDVSEVKRLQHQLEQLARTDPLTSLLNRRSFTALLDTELERVRRGQTSVSLLMLDLDNFKHVNDRFGHMAGDRVLEAVGRILTEETGPHDIAARLGGDEFCIALIGTDGTVAHAIAQRITARVGTIADENSSLIGVTASVGVSTADGPDVTALDLLAHVDGLMYQAKLSTRTDRR